MAINVKIDLKKIPKGAKIAIAVAPAIIIIVVALFVFVAPKTKEINKLKSDIASQENEIAKDQTMAAKLHELKMANDTLKKELDKLQEQLPEEKEVSSLLKQISEEAAKSDVEMLSWKPEAKRPHPSGIVEEVPFTLTLTGTYHNLGVFFSNLTRLNRIVNISEIKLGSPKSQKGEIILDISLKASTFSAVKGAG